MQNIMQYLSPQYESKFGSESRISTSWNPGVFIDIDGVVLKGGKPFDWSKEAIHVTQQELFTTIFRRILNVDGSNSLLEHRLYGTIRFHSCS